MLRGIHKASSNWLGRAVMGVLLGLIAISFGIWGIGDIFRGFGQSTLVKVGGAEIQIETFRQTYQERLRLIGQQLGRPILPDQARMIGLDRQVLAQTIAETALDDRARAMRLGLSDAEIARRVAEDPNFKGLTGQFDRTRFEQLIRNIGFNETRYLADQRRSALRQQLLGTITGDVVVPKLATDSLNRFQNEQRTVEYVLLDRAQAGDVPDPAPDALTRYFEERKVLFRAPEYRKIQMMVVTPAEVAATIEVPDADLKAAYQQRMASYTTPERRHVQQIQFPTIDEARAAADRLAAGTPFEAIASERGLKDSDMDLGTVAKSAMVDRPVADAAFALKEGEVSAPIEGRFGVVLVRVEKIEPGQQKSLEEVAPALKSQIANERARSQMLDLRDKIEDERLSDATLADAAKKLNLKLRVIEAVDRQGKAPDGTPVADLPQGVDVLSAAYGSEVNGDNDPLTIPGNGGYVWFQVTGITPARDHALDEVKDQVLTRWRDEEIAKRLKAKSAELVDKLKAGTSLADLAAADKLKLETATGLKRNAPQPPISAAALSEIYNTARNAFGSADGATPIDRIVFRVTDILTPPVDPNSTEAKRTDDVLRRALADDLIAQYVQQIENDIGVTVNQDALNQITGASAN